ncbi:hypothetical protein [Niallia taxi]|uniref:hypothetical protein n=1 Tax=Niallia taxi TaxID=2499688 RepID=UPI003D2AE325
MGYILPLTNYQYEQYVRQDLSLKEKSFKSEKINAPAAVSTTYENERQFLAASASNKQEFSKREREGADKLFAELTGKGQNFNELV